jgi:hypothetical protein
MRRMPTIARPPETDEPALHRVALRLGDDASVGAPATPPEVLLPLGGEPDPRPAPRERELWHDAAFRRRVDIIRRQLAPLRSRAALAASYGREADHRLHDGHVAPVLTALQVAYALRWLELAEPVPLLLSWLDLFDAPLD